MAVEEGELISAAAALFPMANPRPYPRNVSFRHRYSAID